MSIKHMTAQNAQTIVDAFADKVYLDRNSETINAMLTDLKQRLTAHAIDTTADQTEALMEIIDLVEVTCDEHKIAIHNPDYDEAVKEGEDPATLSKLYGDLYFTLEDTARQEIFGN